MKVKFYTLLAVLTIVIISCKSASKSYDKGNYAQAIELSVKKLQKNPSDGESKQILKDAYRFAVEEHEGRIKNHSNSSSDQKWEWIYNEYSALQGIYTTIRQSPEGFKYVKPTDYSSYQQTYSDKASEMHIGRAEEFMKEEEKESYQKAYREYQAALRYKPSDHIIQAKMKEAYDAAVVNVMIMPIEHYTYMANTQELRNFETELLRNLQYQMNNDFVKFFSRYNSKNIDPDHVMELRFNNLDFGRAHDERSSRQVSREVVIKEVVYRPDSVIKQYGKVYATVTTTKRTMQSEGLFAVNIRDQQGRMMFNDQFRGDHVWLTEFASYTGDERALSDSDKQLINRSQGTQPREEEIMREITREINSELVQRLRSYYSRY